MLDGLASGVASFLGLTPGGFVTTGGLGWGRPLLLVLLLAVSIRLRSQIPVRRTFWLTAVVLLSFWFLTAANATIGRPPIASRYQYIGVVLSLLVAADLAAGIRVTPLGIAIALGIACLAVGGNLSVLHQSYAAIARVTPTVRGGLAGLEIAADSVDPNLELTEQNSDFNYVGSIRAGPYLSAVDAFGSPAYSQSALPRAPENARVAADKVLAGALGLAIEPLPTVSLAAGKGEAPSLVNPPGALAGTRPGCIAVRRVRNGAPVVSLPPGGAIIATARGGGASLRLRRFATASFPIYAGGLRGAARLPIPRDGSARPWQLQVDATGEVTVCGISSSLVARTGRLAVSPGRGG